jgi:hypothetical protein
MLVFGLICLLIKKKKNGIHNEKEKNENEKD